MQNVPRCAWWAGCRALYVALVVLATCALRADEVPDARLRPYAAEGNHPWNRVHDALFVRQRSDRQRRAHLIDPYLYQGGTYLLVGESHRQAVAVLDEFLASHGEQLIDEPRKRLMFERDLWAAFDYVA